MGDCSFLLRSFHGQSSAPSLPFKPPDARLLLINIAPINDLVVATRIAPKFRREGKSIRDKMRNSDKRLEFSNHVAYRHRPCCTALSQCSTFTFATPCPTEVRDRSRLGQECAPPSRSACHLCRNVCASFSEKHSKPPHFIALLLQCFVSR